MSPEQRQTTVADVRNDIYSIGIILEQMELGVSYRYIIKRCKQPIEYRFQNATELLNSMNATASHLKKIVVASWALLTVVLLLLVGIQLRQAAEQEDRLAMLNTTMEQQREAQQEQMEIQQQQLSEVTDTLARLKAYNQEQIEQESMLQTKRVKMKSATEKGYAIVDRAMRQTGIDQHLDTLSDIRYLWPDFTKKSQAGLQAIEAYKREINSSFDTHETEQIVSALSQHVAEKVEKWNQKIIDIAK